MLRHSRRTLFPIESHSFETPDGPVTAALVNNPDAGHTGDQIWFMLKFSNGRALTLKLSEATLHHDPEEQYRRQAIRIVEDWLTDDSGPATIEFYG